LRERDPRPHAHGVGSDRSRRWRRGEGGRGSARWPPVRVVGLFVADA
jgi:hypothetical protein